jgi:putative flippase GtrA
MNKKEFWRAVKFVLFSISAGVIQIVSFTLLQEIVIKDVNQPYGWSYFISLALSVIWNFTFNRKFTFKSANNVPIAMLKVLGYYVVFTPISIFGGVALVNVGWNEYLVLAISMVVNFVTEYIFDTLVVFRNSIDTNDIAKKQAQADEQNNTTQGAVDEQVDQQIDE